MRNEVELPRLAMRILNKQEARTMIQKVEVPKFVQLFDRGRHTKKSLGGHWFASTNTCQRCGLTKQQLAKLLQKKGRQ